VGFFILLVAFIATFPLYARAYDIRVLTTMLMYVVLSVSWAMFSGSTGYMSLAPAAFFGIGVYTMALAQDYLPFPVIIVIGGLVAFAFALLVGLVTLRLKGIYFAIFTFGLVVFLSEMVYYVSSQVGQTRGIDVIPFARDTLLYIMFGLAVVTVIAIYFIRRSRLGLAMQSIGGNEEAAAHMGINTTMVKVFGFAISSFFMGAAGVVTAPALIYVDNRIAFSLFYSFMPILMAVFGGMGQLHGPVVGALIFGYLAKTLRAQLYDYFMLGFGIILVVVILFLPNGVVGLVPILRDKLGPVVSKLRKGNEGEQHASP
jgi:branched-chain amino acid transport system permease protein